MCVQFQLNSLLFALSYVPVFPTYTTITICTSITITTCLHFCSLKHLQLFGKSLQRRSLNHSCFVQMQLHTRLTDFLLTGCLFCLALLQSNTNSLMNILEVEQHPYYCTISYVPYIHTYIFDQCNPLTRISMQFSHHLC